MLTMALAGDTMLGRKVADQLDADPKTPLVDAAVHAFLASADLTVVNLECCISRRGQRWPDPGKPFFFRAPPHAAERLAELGVDAVTLANNHALDYGHVALTDTLAHLEAVGIKVAGAGTDLDQARAPAMLEARDGRVALVGFSDHPADFAAAPDRPGIAYAPLRHGVPDWLHSTVARAATVDLVVVSPHWGPNMVTAPVEHVRAAAPVLARAGAGLIAGHSAHVPHGIGMVEGTAICYDLGGLIDDYAVHPALRNDLGFVWRVHIEGGQPRRLEALPIALEFCFTRAADGPDARWLRRRLVEACAALDTTATDDGSVVGVDLPRGAGQQPRLPRGAGQ